MSIPEIKIIFLKYFTELLVLHTQRICGGFGQNTSANVAGEGMILGNVIKQFCQ